MPKALAVLDLAKAPAATRFRVWLAANGLKQQDAAERLRVSDSHLSYVLRGRRGVNAELSRAISHMTGGFVVFAPTGQAGEDLIQDNAEADDASTANTGRRRGKRAA